MSQARARQNTKNQVYRPQIGLQMPLNEMEPYQRDMLNAPRENEFDLRTEITDPKTGLLLKFQPYRLEVSQSNGATSEIYYRRDDERSPEKRYAANGLCLDKEPVKGAVTK